MSKSSSFLDSLSAIGTISTDSSLSVADETILSDRLSVLLGTASFASALTVKQSLYVGSAVSAFADASFMFLTTVRIVGSTSLGSSLSQSEVSCAWVAV